jgi:hypothetical protein
LAFLYGNAIGSEFQSRLNTASVSGRIKYLLTLRYKLRLILRELFSC